VRHQRLRVLIATKKGKSIRFDEQQVRPMGRNTSGVKAIELEEDDQVVGMAHTNRVSTRSWRCARAAMASGRPSTSSAARTGRKGIILIDASERNGRRGHRARASGARDRAGDRSRQTIRTRVDEIRETGRNAQGVKLMSVGEDERV